MQQPEASSKTNYKLAVLDRERAVRKALHERMVYYKSQHRTLGCKVTHMIGIPMIILSLVAFPFNKRLSLLLQTGGWILQFVGHFVYEHNKPVLFALPAPHLTVIAAIEFVRQEWKKFFAGEDL